MQSVPDLCVEAGGRGTSCRFAPGPRACSSGMSSLQQLLALGLEALPEGVPTSNHRYLHKSKPCGRAFMWEPLLTLKKTPKPCVQGAQ